MLTAHPNYAPLFFYDKNMTKASKMMAVVWTLAGQLLQLGSPPRYHSFELYHSGTIVADKLLLKMGLTATFSTITLVESSSLQNRPKRCTSIYLHSIYGLGRCLFLDKILRVARQERCIHNSKSQSQRRHD